ncbi:lysozyme [Sphingobacterium spiritivorum]|uniref:lysozyme n=1 Tax=Sphingobacterium spiritivorum TaxID=258 RepID=UPI003DA27BD1
MKISSKGIQFIKNEEGFKENAYQDSVGVWTIGYGTTYYENGTRVKKGDKMSRAEADRILVKQLSTVYEPVIKQTVKKPLNQNQYDALSSLIYNIGGTAFRGSTLLKRINEDPNSGTVLSEIQRWKFAGSKPILLGRRVREVNLYSSKSGLDTKALVIILIAVTACFLLSK